MDANIFTNVFESIFDKYPDIPRGKTIGLLVSEIEKKKFDLQDEVFIENALADKEHPIATQFFDSIKAYSDTNRFSEEKLREFLSTDEGASLVIDVFLQNVESTINFYYNAVISKHFVDF